MHGLQRLARSSKDWWRDFWCAAAAAALPSAHALPTQLDLAEPAGVPLGHADGPAVVVVAAPFVALGPCSASRTDQPRHLHA